jgi:uncharacterized protein YcnI
MSRTRTSTSTRRTAKVLRTTATLSLAALMAAAPAFAHVHVEADHIEPGEETVLTFDVPNESDTGSPTTQISVALPNLTAVSTQAMPGWTVKLDRDVAAGTVRSITWTAAPGAEIGPDQFGLFRASMMLPTTDTVSFPTTQTYGDGSVVRWDQPPLPGGAEPEHPTPELNLKGSAPGAEPDQHGAAPTVAAAPAPAATTSAPDTTARWLAGGALLVAAAGTALAVITRRRRQP